MQNKEMEEVCNKFVKFCLFIYSKPKAQPTLELLKEQLKMTE